MRVALRSVAAQICLLALVALLLLGATFVGALRGGLIPQFSQIIAVSPRLALVIENGPFCVPEAPLAACHTAVRSEFRVWLYADNQKREIVAHSWGQ